MIATGAALLGWVPRAAMRPAEVPSQRSPYKAIAEHHVPDLIPGARNLFVTGGLMAAIPSTIGRDWLAVDEGTPAAMPPDDLATRILIAEGGPGRNPASSAAGYGQFLRGTWLDLFNRTYPELARKLSADQILALREVKPLAADLTRQYAHENAETLSRQGVPTSDAVLSLAHAVGPGAALSIVTAPSTRPVRELLSPEAIAANPQFATLTASTLRQWAGDRIKGDRVALPATRAILRPADPVVITISAAQDFRLEGGKMASEVLRTNQSRIAELQHAVAQLPAASGRDHTSPGAKLPVTNGAGNSGAAEAVFAAIQAVGSRPGNERLRYFLKYRSQPGRVPPMVLRDLALVLIDKLEAENATLVDRAQQMHGATKVRTN